MKKQSLKKSLSLFLAVVMVLGLLPLSAFASETSGTVVHQGETVVGYASDQSEILQLQKTATKVGENKFRIDLTVDTKDEVTSYVEGSSAQVVLVIDASGSMSGNKVAAAKTAAKAFAGTMLGKDASPDNRIAVVSFGEKATTHTGLSGDLATVNKAIDKVPASGGTNIQAGIRAAQDLLKNVEGQKFIVLLGDGVPTYSYMGTAGTPATIPRVTWKSGGLLGQSKAEYSSYDYRLTAFNTRILGDGQDVELPDDFWDTDEYNINLDGDSKNYRRVTENMIPTISQAYLAKEAGVEIYSVYLTGKNESSKDLTIGAHVLKNVASGEGHYMTTSDLADLAKLFQNISVEIINKTNVWKITDPMGPSFIDWAGTEGKDPIPGVGFDPETKTMTWNLLDPSVKPGKSTLQGFQYQYKMSYLVTLDTAGVGFDEQYSGGYPTNGTTTLRYFMGDQFDETAVQEMNFDVPTVSGTVPMANYKIEFYKLPPNTEPGVDNANYVPVESHTVNGTAKLHTPVDVTKVGSEGYQANYLTKYSGGKGIPYAYEGGTTSLTLGTGENVLRLYYAPVKTQVTVNHYYRETYFDESGALVTPEYPTRPDTTVTVPGADAPAADWLYVNGKYTASTITTGGYTLDTEVSDALDMDALQEHNNIIDLYYTRQKPEQASDATVSVYHVYQEEKWELTDGRYQKVTKEGTEQPVTGPVDSISGAGYRVNLAPVNGFAYDSHTVNDSQENAVEGETLTVTLVPGENKIVVTFLKAAPDAPEAAPATIEVTHTYTKSVTTVDADGKVHVDTIPAEDVVDTITQRADGTRYYVGERFEVEDFHYGSDPAGLYSLVENQVLTIESLVSTQETSNTNKLTVHYALKKAPEQAEATVTHLYRTFKNVALTETVENPETGVPEEVIIGYETVEDVAARERVSGEPVQLYVGAKFEPAELGKEGFTYQEADPSRWLLISKDGNNAITLYYDSDEVTEGRAPADIKVRHTYITNLKAVYEGKVETRPQIDFTSSLDEPDANDMFKGYAGDAFPPVVKTTHNGKEYLLTEGSQGEVVLQSGTNSTIELKYARDGEDLTSSQGLVVNYHYAELQMYVNESGVAVYPDYRERSLYTKDEGESGAVTLQDAYQGVVVDIASSGRPGYTPDTANKAQVSLEEGLTTVDLYFYKEIPLEQVDVAVEHYDTKSTTGIDGSVSSMGPTLREGAGQTIQKYVGERVTVPASEQGGYQYSGFALPETVVDGALDEAQKTVSFTVPAGGTTLRFDYLWTENLSQPAAYVVNYFYKSVDWNQRPEDVAYPEEPQKREPFGSLFATNQVSAKPIFRLDDDAKPLGDVLDQVVTVPEKYSEADGAYSIVLEAGEGNVINFYLYNSFDSRVEVPVHVNYTYETFDTATQTVIHSVGFSDTYNKADGAWAGNSFSVGERTDGGFVLSEKFNKPVYTFVTGEGAQNPVTYAFHAVNPESGTLQLSTQMVEDQTNQISITYRINPETTTYVVQHEYYYDNVRRGGSTAQAVAGDVGTEIRLADVAVQQVFEGVTYGAPTASPEAITLSADAARNVMTLTYRYTTTVDPTPPVGPPTTGGDEGDDGEDNAPPVVTIPETETPQGAAPTTPETPVSPVVTVPEINIPETEVPQAPAPEGEFEIVDEETPLGALPQTGTAVDPSVTLGRMALLASLAAAGLSVLLGQKRKDEETEAQ